MADSNMAMTNNGQTGQALSIEYLIEKAVENAMNRALIKLDEYVYKAAKKVDATVERALDQAFTKFSEHVNEVQESTRKVEEAVQKALDEALAKISNRFKELPPTIRMEQDQQEPVEVKETGIATHTVINKPEEPGSEPMELEESESTSIADIEEDDSDDDDDCSENFPQVIWEYPRPDLTYAIHLDDNRKAMLAINEDYTYPSLVALAYVNAGVDKDESRYCHWKCIKRGRKEGFYFMNVATLTYLGVSFRGHSPDLNADSKNHRGNTRFSPESVNGDSYLLQARNDRCSAYVTATYDAYDKCTPFDENDIIFSCWKEKGDWLMKWKFRRISNQ